MGLSEIDERALLNSLESIVYHNAAANPNYCPYCLRCRDLVRMKIIERFYWRCACGAECDLRAYITRFHQELSPRIPIAGG